MASLDDGSPHFQVLISGEYKQYTKISQRVDFYIWVYDLLVRLGDETRWALAAWIVAQNALLLGHVGDLPFTKSVCSFWGYVCPGLQAAMRSGNQVIFDDVLPKLLALVLEGVRDGPLLQLRAMKWDAQTLAEEQGLVRPLYDGMDGEDREGLYDIASQKLMTDVGARLLKLGVIKKRTNCRPGEVPAPPPHG